MRAAAGLVLALVALGATLVLSTRGCRSARDDRPRAAEPVAIAGPYAHGPAAVESAPARDERAGEGAREPSRARARPARGVETAPIDAATAPLVVVHGRVLASADPRLAPPLLDVALNGTGGAWVFTQTSEDGHYAVAGLAPGAWTLSATANGFRGARLELALTAEAPIVRVDVALQRATLIAVRIVDPHGEPLLAAIRARERSGLRAPSLPTVVATTEPPGPTIAEAGGENLHVRDGTYVQGGSLLELAGPGCAGVLVLDGDPPVHVSLVGGTRVLETRWVEPGTEEIEFAVDPEALLGEHGFVRARFVDPHGEDVAGVLSIQPLDEAWILKEQPWTRSLLPGGYSLGFSAEGLARYERTFTLEAGEELDLGEVVLEPERTIRGRLLDPDGNPVRATLEVGRRDEQGVLRFDEDMGYVSATDGDYDIPGLVADRYWLRVDPDAIALRPNEERRDVWVSGHVEVSTLGGSVSGLDLRLARAGFVELRNAEALPEGLPYELLDARGDRVRRGALRVGSLPRFALAPGSYTLVLFDLEWKELSRRALEVGEGVLEVDLGS